MIGLKNIYLEKWRKNNGHLIEHMKINFERFFIRIIKTGVILILFTPLVILPFGFYVSIYPKTIFFQALVEIIFLLYILLVWVNKKYLPKISFISLAVVLFVVFLFISAIGGFNFCRSFWGDFARSTGIILHLHLLAFFLIVVSVFKDEKTWIKFLKYSVFFSIASSFFGLLQKVGLFHFSQKIDDIRISGTMLNPDLFGAYLVLSIFLGLFIAATERKKLFKLFWLTAVFLNCFTLFLSGTRASWLALIAGLIFIFVSLFFSREYEKERKTLLFLFLFFIIFIFVLSLFQTGFFSREGYLFERLISVFNLEFPNSRLISWRIALEAWKERPILGWGPESFGFLFAKYFNAEYLVYIPESMLFDYPHNKIMELLATTGFLGLFSFLLIFFAIFYTLHNDRKNNQKDRAGNIFKIIFSGFFIAYLVQGFFSFDTLPVYLIFFLALGFVVIKSQTGKRTLKVAWEKGRIAFKPILIILIILTSLSFYEISFKMAKVDFILGKAAKLEKNDFKKALSIYEKTLAMNTVYNKDFNLAIGVRLMNIFDTSAGEIEKKAMLPVFNKIKLSLGEDLERPDKWYLNYYSSIIEIERRTYLLTGDINSLKRIEEVSRKALEFNDQRVSFYRFIGEKKIIEGKDDEGEDFYKKALLLSPPRAESLILFHKNLGYAYLGKGNKTKAVGNFKKAFDIYYVLAKKNLILLPPIFSEETKNEVVFSGRLMIFYYKDLKDFQAAEEVYKKCLEIFPDYSRVINIIYQKIQS